MMVTFLQPGCRHLLISTRQKRQSVFSRQVNLENLGCVSITDAIAGMRGGLFCHWKSNLTAVRGVRVSDRTGSLNQPCDAFLFPWWSLKLCLNAPGSRGTGEHRSVAAEMWPERCGTMQKVNTTLAASWRPIQVHVYYHAEISMLPQGLPGHLVFCCSALEVRLARSAARLHGPPCETAFWGFCVRASSLHT